MSDSHFRNLPIPYFSQRENIYEWQEREPQYNGEDSLGEPILNPNKGNIIQWTAEDEAKDPPHKAGTPKNQRSLAYSSCNITCLCMVLNYLGISHETPTQMLEKAFDVGDPKNTDFLNLLNESGLNIDMGNPSYDIIQSNRFAPAFVKAFYEDRGVKCKTQWDGITSSSFTAMENEIAKGLPCIMYIGSAVPTVNLNNNNDLKNFLTENTEIRTDTRINLGTDDESGIVVSYATMCDMNEQFSTLENPESTDQQKEEAQTELDNYRNAINRLKIATSGSHFVVVRGFTEDCVIINDPWGEPNRNNDNSMKLTPSGYWDYYNSSIYGDSILVKKTDFKKRYRDDGSYFAWTFHVNNLWDFTYHNILPRSERPQSIHYDSCYNKEEFNLGAFPIRKSLTWHNGIHLKGDNEQVNSIGPGCVVAARIKDKPSGDDSTYNGSRCFILLKHHMNVEGELKEFYSLYYHLKPLLDFSADTVSKYENIKGVDYPNWLKQILERPFNRAVCPYNKNIRAYAYSEIASLEETPLSQILNTWTIPMGSSIVFETIETVKIENIETEVIVFYSEKEDARYFALKNDFRKIYIVEDIIKQIYINKIASLENGEIAYFNDMPSNDGLIEVGSRERIGHTGWFNGYLSLMDPDLIYSEERKGTLPPINKMFQLEIFSDENIIPDFKDIGFEDIDMTNGSQTNILNGEEILNTLSNEYKILKDDFFKELADFGIISTNEFLDFYQDTFGSERLRSCIVQGYNEGSNEISWSEAYDNAKGFLKNTFGILGTTWDTISNTANSQSFFMNQAEYIEKFRIPHIWFDENMREAMNPSENTLFRQGKMTSYHPIRFLKWLIEYNWQEESV